MTWEYRVVKSIGKTGVSWFDVALVECDDHGTPLPGFDCDGGEVLNAPDLDGLKELMAKVNAAMTKPVVEWHEAAELVS